MTDLSTLGAYRLIAELGHGGMADVYLAAAEGPVGSGFTKLAVVKKLRSNLADDPELVSMLMDEARVTARLSHPNVIQLFEVARHADQYFLAIEFLEGQPLHRVEQRITKSARHEPDGFFSRDTYFAVIADVLAGLHHAHELADYDGSALGIVHRDVTPHNVFVTYDGVVKVVDFGIAKAIGRLTETDHGVVKGKIRYMSPEQAAGGRVDRRADIFAAGVMLWNLATGTKLWANRTDIAVAHALRDGDYPASPRELFPDVPEEIDAICRRALAFRREDRYETAADMRADLEAFLGPAGSDAHKNLATLMKQIFATERAQLRKILESSSLTKVPSVRAFSVADGFPAPERTALMPVAASAAEIVRAGARAAESPSLTPVALRSARASAPVPGPASAAVASAREPSAPEPSPRAPRSRYVQTAGVAGLALVLAVVAVVGTPSGPSPGDRLHASAARFGSQRTSLAENRLRKAVPADTEAASLPGRRSVRDRRSAGPLSGAPSTETTDVSAHPTAASTSTTPGLADGGTTKRTALDEGDPWAGRAR